MSPLFTKTNMCVWYCFCFVYKIILLLNNKQKLEWATKCKKDFEFILKSLTLDIWANHIKVSSETQVTSFHRRRICVSCKLIAVEMLWCVWLSFIHCLDCTLLTVLKPFTSLLFQSIVWSLISRTPEPRAFILLFYTHKQISSEEPRGFVF